MKKVLISTILGLAVFDTVGASIISRSFFDEKIADYATLESLNSKADKNEVTTLSDKIGDLYLLSDTLPIPPDYIEVFGVSMNGLKIPSTLTHLILNMLFAEEGFPSFHNLSNSILSGGTMTNGFIYYGLPKLTEEVDKIGVVPDGYNNLADALAAVKITADTAKELAEKAIPNVLNESSNGKYVLTAEKVGDTATYKWEIIDRTTTENTATTN